MPDLSPGSRVLLARPENPGHPFAGSAGTVDHLASPGRPGFEYAEVAGRKTRVPVVLPDTLAFVTFACVVPPPRPQFAKGTTMALWQSELDVIPSPPGEDKSS